MSPPGHDACPVCGSAVRGIVAVRALLGGTEFHLAHTGALAHGKTHPDDALVIVEFTCPHGHQWSLEFGDPLDGPPATEPGGALH